jgi:thiol-disulfide isomerase/thioredoxin
MPGHLSIGKGQYAPDKDLGSFFPFTTTVGCPILYFMKKPAFLFIVCLLTVFFLGGPVFGSDITNKSTDMFLLTFGKGKIETRFYSDYFCSACKALEPKIEYLIADLVKQNVITLTFVDVPLHQHSALYARYFLYILNSKKEIGHALKARSVLFEAAQQKIADKDGLEAFLNSKGIKFKPFEPQPVFNILKQYLAGDQIRATPTCVVIKGGKKEFFQGGQNITTMLESLRSGPKE